MVTGNNDYSQALENAELRSHMSSVNSIRPQTPAPHQRTSPRLERSRPNTGLRVQSRTGSASPRPITTTAASHNEQINIKERLKTAPHLTETGSRDSVLITELPDELDIPGLPDDVNIEELLQDDDERCQRLIKYNTESDPEHLDEGHDTDLDDEPSKFISL